MPAAIPYLTRNWVENISFLFDSYFVTTIIHELKRNVVQWIQFMMWEIEYMNEVLKWRQKPWKSPGEPFLVHVLGATQCVSIFTLHIVEQITSGTANLKLKPSEVTMHHEWLMSSVPPVQLATLVIAHSSTNVSPTEKNIKKINCSSSLDYSEAWKD